MTIRLDKPWVALAGLDEAEIPAQLGVFQLADAGGDVVYIGYAGGTTTFGLRSAIGQSRTELGDQAVAVRYELTHGYLSRWEELMMVHHHDHGRPPRLNDPLDAPRGRLSPE